jgi:hypothetical protein
LRTLSRDAVETTPGVSKARFRAMTLIDMLLRLGCVLVAWMVVYAHLLWLATLRVIGCDVDGDALWRLLLGFAPFAIAGTLCFDLLRPLEDIHRTLRWASAPLVVLVPLCLTAVWPTWQRATVDGLSICATIPAAWWEALWAPAQVVTLAVISVMAWLVWWPKSPT